MAKKTQFDYDLIVIGSGAAGSTAALGAARAGKKVALCEASVFGGESPNWGDMPTKALLHAALLYDEAKRGSRFGLRTSTVGYNYPAMLQWRDTVTKRTGAADNRRYYEKAGVDTYVGLAHFLSPHEISVNRTHLTAKNFLVASGSHFAPPDVYGIETIQYKTPRTLLDSIRPPRSLFIVGSDSEALEYTQLMATLGTKVYLAEKSARLLPEADSEVGELMERYLHETKGVSVLTQTQVIGVEKKGLGVRITYSRGEVTRSVQVDEVMFMTNRLPSTDLGLENAQVDYTPAGIKVNEFLQTSAKHIYAAGDVLGGNTHTQAAMLQGRTVANNLVHKAVAAPETYDVPRVTYTYPAIASVGLSENDCIKRDLSINQSLVPLAMISRSNTSDFTDGFVKLISDKKGTLIGSTIVAPHASEMIHEVSLAIHQGMSASDLALAPHAFLSWNEAVRLAASRLM